MPNQSADINEPFHLLETLLWEPDSGYFLLDEHLRRLKRTAAFFQFSLAEAQVIERLRAAAAQFSARPHRVRLLVAAHGDITTQAVAMPPAGAPTVWRVALATTPIDADNPYLRHKTTRRQVYEAARAAHPDANDVLLWNKRGELTETTIANVVLKFGDDLLTPPASCGLLPGTFREHLLAQSIIRERVITLDELRRCERLFLINSVRRWVEAVLVGILQQKKS